jgi:hypothetical protein
MLTRHITCTATITLPAGSTETTRALVLPNGAVLKPWIVVQNADTEELTHTALEVLGVELEHGEVEISRPKSTALPQLSRNGTAPGELLGQQLAVLDGCRALLALMTNAAPHQRDYQYDPSQWAAANAAHVDDVTAIEAIMRRATDIADHVVN